MLNNVVSFDISNQYRQMDNIQLVDILSKHTKKHSEEVNEESVIYGESSLFKEMISKLTPAKRELVLSAVELYKRSEANKTNVTGIRNSEDIFRTLAPKISDIEVEEVWAIFLNQAAKIIKVERISQGGMTSSSVDSSVILKQAILCGARSMILSHNHPSGNIHPSGEDDRITQNLFQAAKLLKVRLLDHVIIAGNAYYSYADEGRI